MFPPVSEYALALKPIQNAERFKRLREKIGKLYGKLGNTHIGMNTVDGESGFYPEIFKCSVHSLLCAKNARMI